MVTSFPPIICGAITAAAMTNVAHLWEDSFLAEVGIGVGSGLVVMVLVAAIIDLWHWMVGSRNV